MNLDWLMLHLTCCGLAHDEYHDHDHRRHGCDLNWLTLLDLKMMAKAEV